MTTPEPGLLFHFTHINNLESIVSSGLSCDTEVRKSSKEFKEVGNQGIKSRRRVRAVPVDPNGVVSDYVPFYFAARSPMLYAIHMGNVPTYGGGQDEVVYLVTSTKVVVGSGMRFVYTDRNASLTLAKFSSDIDQIDSLVDWKLMRARMFSDTDVDPDRAERRMAEFLVHSHVPWDAFIGVAARTDARAQQVSQIITNLGIGSLPVRTRADWYF